MQFIVSSKTVLNYLDKNTNIKKFTNSILRTYAGLFEQEVNIDEFSIAKKAGITTKLVLANLDRLQKDNIIEYKAVKSDIENCQLDLLADDYNSTLLSFAQTAMQQDQSNSSIHQLISTEEYNRLKIK